MAQTSLYDVLLVDQNATLEEIKLAFKRRALQVHPDKGGSKEEFHLVYQALETLGDPAARQQYDRSLATTSTGPAPRASHAPYPKEKKRKREGKHAQPATSCKAKAKTKPQTFGKKSTTFAGKAPSKPPQATATSAEPQSKQTKLLIKIRDLLKRLPRDARNDVITKQFSHKQRVILERFMVDNADNSSGGTKCHSEAEALAPATTSKRNATHQAGFEIEAVSKATSQSTADSSHESGSVALPTTNCSVAMAKWTERTRRGESSFVQSSCNAICNEPHVLVSEVEAHLRHSKGCHALAAPNSKRGRNLQTDQASSKSPAKARGQDNRKTSNKTKMRGTGHLMKDKRRPDSYTAIIFFDSLGMRTRRCDLKTALDYLMILTSAKQKIRNQAGGGTFVERLQAALAFCASEHGRNLADLKLGFLVFQHAGYFIGSGLWSPIVHSLEVFGKMRSVLEPFHQYCNVIGRQSVYWRYSPMHLEDVWGRFQLAVVEAWKIAGVDSTAILQKIHSRYEERAPFRSASLQVWERQHMGTHDKNKHRPSHLRERHHTGRLECWERRQMALEDKNEHRPSHLRERHPTGRLECWERRQMALEDENKHRPSHLRERHPTGRLECWERRQMALEDKNKHRPSHLRERHPTGRLECWERRQMALEDKNEHRPKKLRQKLQLCASNLSRQLTAIRTLIARWGRMLKREAKLVEKERQKVTRQRKAQQKKDQEERKQVEVLKQKRQREEERSRREWVRKRMRSDLTMDDILGQKDGRHPENGHETTACE